jgi:hypothetical protein
MSNIYELMINESRESLFQLESIATSLDNKAYGLIAFYTLLFSIFAYSNEIFHNNYLYIPLIIIITSLLCLLIAITPRTSHRMTGEIIIRQYGNFSFDDAAGQLAFNYASLEKELTDIYNTKIKYVTLSLIYAAISIITGTIILLYLIFHPSM